MRALSLVSTATFVSLGLAAPGALAQSQVDTSVSVSANGGYSTNPFLAAADEAGAGVAQVDIRPSLDWRTERDVLRLEGYFTRTEYFDTFDATDATGINLNTSSQLDEQSTLRAVLAFDSSVLGAGDAVLARQAADPGPTPGGSAAPPDAGASGELPVDGLPDGDFDLVGQRRNSLSLAVNADIRTDARSILNVGINATGADYPGTRSVASSYRTVGVSVSYRRELSELTSVGARAEQSGVDYKVGPMSKVYTLQAFASHRLAQYWTLDASAGTSLLDGSDDRVIFAGEASICHMHPLARFCLVGSRAPVVSGLSGVRAQTSLGATFDNTIDSRSTLGASATYVWMGSNSQGALDKRRFIALGATYRRDLGHRLSFYTALNSRYLKGTSARARRDMSLRAGIALRFGGPR